MKMRKSIKSCVNIFYDYEYWKMHPVWIAWILPILILPEVECTCSFVGHWHGHYCITISPHWPALVYIYTAPSRCQLTITITIIICSCHWSAFVRCTFYFLFLIFVKCLMFVAARTTFIAVSINLINLRPKLKKFCAHLEIFFQYWWWSSFSISHLIFAKNLPKTLSNICCDIWSALI